MNQLLNDYGIFILVLLFIIFSLHYKNFVNIAIFLILFVAFRNMMANDRALLYAYCISIFYGIVKNFHLLENFTSNNNKLIPGNAKPISAIFEKVNEDKNAATKILNNELKKTNQIEKETESSKETNESSGQIKKLNKKQSKNITNKVKAPEMDEIISEDLIASSNSSTNSASGFTGVSSVPGESPLPPESPYTASASNSAL